MRVQDRKAGILDDHEQHIPDALAPVARSWWASCRGRPVERSASTRS